MICRRSWRRGQAGLRTAVALSLLSGGGLWVSQLGDYKERIIAPGVTFSRVHTPKPLDVQIVRAKLPLHPNLRLLTALAKGRVLGRATVSSMVQRARADGAYVVLAVNGDYFSANGIPSGAFVQDGEIIRIPNDRTMFMVDADGKFSIDRLKSRGTLILPNDKTVRISALNGHPRSKGIFVFTSRFDDVVTVPDDTVFVLASGKSLPLRVDMPHELIVKLVSKGGTAAALSDQEIVLASSDKSSDLLFGLRPGDRISVQFTFEPKGRRVVSAIGGGPRLLREGVPYVEWREELMSKSFAARRHPRTAVGLADGAIVFVTVDGRRLGHSRGMSLYDLAHLMADLGCVDAMNLDGGGSTTSYVRGRVANSPSDGRERRVANALLLVNAAPEAEAERLVITLSHRNVLVGASIQVKVQSEDSSYRLQELDPRKLRWHVVPPLAEVGPGGSVQFFPPINGEPENDVTLTASLVDIPNLSGKANVRVHARLSRLEATPRKLRMRPNGLRKVTLAAFGRDGTEVRFEPDQVKWVVGGGVGIMNPDGTFRTNGKSGSGNVIAILGNQAAIVGVDVEGPRLLLEDFETLNELRFESFPVGMPGGLTLVRAPVVSGNKALKMSYDFTTSTATRAVYARLDREISTPFALSCWVYGDGNGHWLRCRFRDGEGEVHLLTVERFVDWVNEWRQVRLNVPEEFPRPIMLEALYLVESSADKQSRGAILLDDLRVEMVD